MNTFLSRDVPRMHFSRSVPHIHRLSEYSGVPLSKKWILAVEQEKVIL